jgi:predicted NUDIX family NTP pyrophosphohydrolase
MPQRSAGILLYRLTGSDPEVLLVHPGGPFWARKDEGAWSIPKGLYEDPEDPLIAARREFEEEIGVPSIGDATLLGEFKQPGGKLVTAFAAEGDFNLAELRSNTFPLEWPPKSGRLQEFPEADRAGWFTPVDARKKMLKGQIPILEALLERLGKS